MSSIGLSSLVFACVFGCTIFAMVVRRLLPEQHLNAESKDVVKMGLGLIATLTALVLGLLIATAKGTYDAQGGTINEMAANCTLLDRALSRYGPETKDVRDLLKSNVAATLEQIWPSDPSKPVNLVPVGEGKAAGDALYDKVGAMTPKTEAQRELRARAIGLLTDIAQARMRIVSRQDGALPTPFLVVLVFWLSILFAGYGLLSPANGTIILVLIVCAISVSGAVFLMLELSTPFEGILRLSSEPLRHAYVILGQ